LIDVNICNGNCVFIAARVIGGKCLELIVQKYGKEGEEIKIALNETFTVLQLKVEVESKYPVGLHAANMVL